MTWFGMSWLEIATGTFSINTPWRIFRSHQLARNHSLWQHSKHEQAAVGDLGVGGHLQGLEGKIEAVQQRQAVVVHVLAPVQLHRPHVLTPIYNQNHNTITGRFGKFLTIKKLQLLKNSKILYVADSWMWLWILMYNDCTANYLSSLCLF